MRSSLAPRFIALALLALAVVCAPALRPQRALAAAARRPAQSVPTPFPLQTPGPVSGVIELPYPAYGTPVPGVNAGVAATGIPQTLTLDQASDVGFELSPVLAAARADVGVQAAAVRLTRAGLLPALSGGVNLQRTHQQGNSTSQIPTGTGGVGSTVGRSNFDNVTSNDLSLQLSQLIFDGGRLAASVKAAERTESSFADTYRRDLQTESFNVATAYYNYLAALRTTQVDLEIVREDEVQVKLVQAQIEAGTVAKSELATAQLPLAQAKVAVVRAQAAQLAAQATLANAMGLDANVYIVPVDDSPVFTNTPLSSIAIPTYDAAQTRALALRPDYDNAVQLVEAAKYSLKSAGLAYFPTLSASANATDSSTDPSGGSFRNGQTLGVDLSIPIYDGGARAATIAENRGQLAIAQADLQNEKLSVSLGVKQALTNLVSARAALVQTQQEYATAVVNLQATQAQYRAGVTTLPLLLNAQVGISQALVDQVTAVYTLRQAEQSYLYAVGDNYQGTAP
ncbi:MAG: TolC family protein [Vulcanimicrobiaceae bacterium]